MLQRFAQDASRQDVAVSKGIGSIDEDDVDVSIKLPVLEAIVEDEDLSIEFFNGHTATYGPVPTDEDGNPHEAPGHETRFIAPFFSRQEYHATIGHDRSAALLPFRVITSVEEGNAPAPGRKFLGQHTGHGRLPRPSDGNIAQADDDGRESFLPLLMIGKGAVLHDDGLSINPRGAAKEEQSRPVPPVMFFASCQIMKVSSSCRSQGHRLTSRSESIPTFLAVYLNSYESPLDFPERRQYNFASSLRPGRD